MATSAYVHRLQFLYMHRNLKNSMETEGEREREREREREGERREIERGRRERGGERERERGRGERKKERERGRERVVLSGGGVLATNFCTLHLLKLHCMHVPLNHFKFVLQRFLLLHCFELHAGHACTCTRTCSSVYYMHVVYGISSWFTDQQSCLHSTVCHQPIIV